MHGIRGNRPHLARAVLMHRTMPSFEDARACILEHVDVLGSEPAALLDCVDRVLACDVVAPLGPAALGQLRDGRLRRALGRLHVAAHLALSGYLPAGGHSQDAVAAGTAAKIFTGAPLPPGATPSSRWRTRRSATGTCTRARPVRPGAHVRRKGEDIRAGETILRRGTVIGPSEVSLLASLSQVSIPVVRRARVAILSTGDELVEPGGSLSPGKIYDSNALAVATAVKQIGGEPINLGIARDDKASLAGS